MYFIEKFDREPVLALLLRIIKNYIANLTPNQYFQNKYVVANVHKFIMCVTTL